MTTSAGTVEPSTTTGIEGSISKSSTTAEDILRPVVAQDDVVSYLGACGYAAESPTKWSAVRLSCLGKPVLRLALGGHSERQKHTYYDIQCTFTARKPTLRLDWNVQRRLTQLRDEFHDMVKEGLGKDYATVFAQAPFARRGGLAGTTGRLQVWLETLATCVNEESLSPDLVAKILQYLDAPLPSYLCEGPGTTQKVECSDPLPKPMFPPKLDLPLPSTLPPATNGKCDAACSPMRTPREDLQETVADDKENDAAQFSASKRQHGYKKLRDWFTAMKHSVGKKLIE